MASQPSNGRALLRPSREAAVLCALWIAAIALRPRSVGGVRIISYAVIPGRRSEAEENPESICGRPPARKVGAERRGPIACDHMSGLLSRSHMTAAKMVSATRVSKHNRDIEYRWIPRTVSRLGIDRPHHLLRLEQASGLRSRDDTSPLPQTRYGFTSVRCVLAPHGLPLAASARRCAEPPDSEAPRRARAAATAS